jgi:ABC-type transport system involved in multi-copper enzyme maturation permease subunit
MLFRIAAFELRQQLRSHVFWIVFAISLLMVVGALSNEQLRVGIGAERGGALVVRTHLLWSLFYMFTAAAFVADAVLRDDMTGFAPIIHAAPVRRGDYLLGRFLGAYGATCACYLSVPAALIASPYLPWTDPALAARADAGSYAIGLLALGLPNLLISSAFFFGLATATRSMNGTLIGAVMLLILYGAGQGGGVSALAEPFGFAAIEEGGSGLLLNRGLWLILSVALIAAAALRFKPSNDSSASPRRRGSRVDAAVESSGVPAFAGMTGRPLAQPSFGRATLLAQYGARTKLELRQTLGSPVFAILLALGLAHALRTLWAAPAGDPLRTLIDAFLLVPTVVAIFFAGELWWSEREHRVEPLIGATPLPRSALVLPKLLGLSLALLGLALVSGAAALVVPAIKDSAGPGVLGVMLGYVLPKAFDWILVGVLALFLQSLSRNKLAGWGLMVLWLIASLAMEYTGYVSPLYRYGETPVYPRTEWTEGESFSAYRLYWGAVALLLLALTMRQLRADAGS